MLNDFEGWIVKVQETLNTNLGDIKSDVDDFFRISDKQIKDYFESLSDSELLSRKIEVVSEIQSTVE